MGQRLRLPGARDVRATLDGADDHRGTDACVVACPPHPRMGGDRHDPRLRAVSDALGRRDLDCLRIDYGPWDEGRGERTDAHIALAWASERDYRQVALFGYSFGGAVALCAAADTVREDPGIAPDAVSLLAPAGTLGGETVAGAVDALDCPLQVVAGERDDAVDSRPVCERASAAGHAVEWLPADHFYVGQRERMADLVATFLSDRLVGA